MMGRVDTDHLRMIINYSLDGDLLPKPTARGILDIGKISTKMGIPR